MRDILVKLYVDDDEMFMVQEMARKANKSINEFLRMVLYYQAGVSTTFPTSMIEKFTRRTHRSKPRPEE